MVKVNDMKINEIFYSIQGEGPQIGMPAWFIRVSGCNLRCSFCDSAYAFEEGKDMSIESITETIFANICNNVVITGGEPLLQKDLIQLVKNLAHMNVYIETNGTIYDSHFIGFATFIVSPKFQFLNDKYLESLKKWSGLASFKFVIGNKQDFDNAVKLCKKLKLDKISKVKKIYFMPKGITDKKIKETMKSMTEWIKKEVPYVRISPRLQIYLWGNQRGV